MYEQSRRGSIPTVTLGRYRRYRVEAIEEWIERLEAGDAGGAQLMAKRARSVRVSGKL